ncbi:CBS domain-containing protein [Bdellovibrio reynosensis]|uniref:CBS domain-containing protein n=1 Tax=Bdellovibrio reynosensis TaxID=2835041 RepID=A0ABY4C988_9BACT|nr:CBS domain-containing protein [Bdellovibrio reynosensis]UOF01034.1 CBS domain-containing protein [Bdellovibrio reynosensis]
MRIALKDHMSRKLITINQGATVAEAYRLMSNFWIRHLPVMDEKEEFIVGMLSDRDLLRATNTNTPVEKVMTTPIRTFSEDTPIKAVVEAMIEEKISAYLITKDDEVIGIATTEDMMVLLDQMLKRDDAGHGWVLNEILINPALQRTAYILGQAGI